MGTTGAETIGSGCERQALFPGDLAESVLLWVPLLSRWESSDRWAEKPAFKVQACEEIWGLAFRTSYISTKV